MVYDRTDVKCYETKSRLKLCSPASSSALIVMFPSLFGAISNCSKAFSDISFLSFDCNFDVSKMLVLSFSSSFVFAESVAFLPIISLFTDALLLLPLVLSAAEAKLSISSAKFVSAVLFVLSVTAMLLSGSVTISFLLEMDKFASVWLISLTSRLPVN